MRPQLRLQIESIIASSTGTHSPIRQISGVSGGCINVAQIVELEDDRRFFVKSNSHAPADLFQREAEGLLAMASTETIRVPDVIGWQDGRDGCLILEAIEPSRKSASFFEKFGQQLAQMHKSDSVVNAFGWEADNYLGNSVQPNGFNEDWISFWRDQRFGFQFKLAKSNGYFSGQFAKLAERLQTRLGDWLTIDEPPCLIHGDLWSGNYMVGPSGEPVLVDPAVYYAHREAEFGMTTLFGGFDRAFYEGYEQIWPLANGADDRIAIYRLYHLLNHLNLFGSSYLAGCLEIMKKYAGHIES